ncbi:MAG: GAF domain-containing sensor histidine kinase [Thermodesulfovibrionales bacterium]
MKEDAFIPEKMNKITPFPPFKGGNEGAVPDWTGRALSTIIRLNNITGFLPVEINSTLKAIVNEVSNLFNLHTSCIYTVENGMLNLAAFRTPDGLSPDIHFNSSITACAALRDGLPFISCGSENYRLICQNRKVSSEDLSHICIPLLTGNDINGVFSVSFPRESRMSKAEMDVLFSIANQASMTIQRYRLFETLKRERQEMEEAYKEISFLNEMLRQKIEELKEARYRLLQSEKLVAIGELAAGLCHEINNPLSIILNRIECLRMESGELLLPEPVLKDLDVIHLYASKTSSIVHDLLIFSRPHPVEFRPVRLEAVFNEVIRMLEEDLKKNNCFVETVISQDMPEIYGDHDRFEQVFRNLISNAIDAMPEGGRITIDARISSEKSGFVEITVKDEGTGIPDEIIHRIFDPFFTTKKLGRGTGLGLSICYGIIKNHGGDIAVKTSLNTGSIFTVYLPLRGVPVKEGSYAEGKNPRNR